MTFVPAQSVPPKLASARKPSLEPTPPERALQPEPFQRAALPVERPTTSPGGSGSIERTIPTPGDGAAVHVSPVLRHAPRPPTQRRSRRVHGDGRREGDGRRKRLLAPRAARRRAARASSPVAAQTSPPRIASEETGWPERPSSAHRSTRRRRRGRRRSPSRSRRPRPTGAKARTSAPADRRPARAAARPPPRAESERREQENREPRDPSSDSRSRHVASNAPRIQSIVSASPSIATTSNRTSRQRARRVLREPGTRRREELPPLDGSDGLGRRPTRGVAAPLHLDEDDGPAVLGHEVDLSPADPDVPRDERRARAPRGSGPPRPRRPVPSASSAARAGAAGRGPARRFRDRPSFASRSFQPGDTGRG